MKHIHFIAIGGSVMHQLAICLYLQGYHVTGSDDEIFEPAYSNLKKYALLPSTLGWHSQNIHAKLDAVIVGMHAKADNPELIAAQQMQLKLYSFPSFIYEACQDKLRVAVAGSHGKTTTTGMLMHILKTAKLNFDYMVGAKISSFEFSVSLQKDTDILVCEADEYPDSVLSQQPKFHLLFPNIAIITGLAWDHINVFPTYQNYTDQFKIFLQKMPSGGTVYYYENDPELVKIIQSQQQLALHFMPYSCLPFQIVNEQTFVNYNDQSIALQIFGNHNLSNFQAAIKVAEQLKVSPEHIAEALATYTPAHKRLEKMDVPNHKIVYRDFAHAPSKVDASMKALRQQYPHKKILAVLELHTFSSLNADFLPQYKHCLDGADTGIVYFSHHALELKRLPILSAFDIQKGFQNNSILVIDNPNKLSEAIQELSARHDIIVFMSSGTFENLNLQNLIN